MSFAVFTSSLAACVQQLARSLHDCIQLDSLILSFTYSSIL